MLAFLIGKNLSGEHLNLMFLIALWTTNNCKGAAGAAQLLETDGTILGRYYEKAHPRSPA